MGGASWIALQVKPENSAGFLDALGVLLGAVAGWHDEFGGSALKVGPPVGNEAVVVVPCHGLAGEVEDGLPGVGGGGVES